MDYLRRRHLFSIAEFSYILKIPVVPPQSIRLPSISYKTTETLIPKLGNSLIFSVLLEHSLLLLVKISAYSIFFWTFQHCTDEPNKGIFLCVHFSDFKSIVSNMHWGLYKQQSTENLYFRAALRNEFCSSCCCWGVRMAHSCCSEGALPQCQHGSKFCKNLKCAELVLQCAVCSVYIAFAANSMGAEEWLDKYYNYFFRNIVINFIWFKRWSSCNFSISNKEQPCWKGLWWEAGHGHSQPKKHPCQNWAVSKKGGQQGQGIVPLFYKGV